MRRKMTLKEKKEKAKILKTRRLIIKQIKSMILDVRTTDVTFEIKPHWIDDRCPQNKVQIGSKMFITINQGM